jgi:hypothetical protein
LTQLRLQLAPFADVGLHTDEMQELSLIIQHRRQRKLIPEAATVLAVVQQLYRASVPGLDSRAHFGHGRGIRIYTLQEATVATDDFFDVVAG